jgi:predicted flap endonuclease-1-like 5' DNA nuclease
MLNIIAAHPLPFIIALLIGIATGWWIWARSRAEEGAVEETVEPYQVPPEAEPEPEPEPAPPVPAPPPVAAPAAAAVVAGTAAAATQDAPPAEEVPDIAPAVGDPDDLKRIKGIGPKLEKLCNSLGVMRFDQIAAWTARDVAKVDAHLGSFKGRITRDEWVDQAKLLADGRVTEHVAKYGA